jgi:hypothetical protein
MYKNVSCEAISLHILLKKTDELIVEETPPNAETAARLNQISMGCKEVLDKLQDLLDKYNSLGTHVGSDGVWFGEYCDDQKSAHGTCWEAYSIQLSSYEVQFQSLSVLCPEEPQSCFFKFLTIVEVYHLKSAWRGSWKSSWPRSAPDCERAP